MPNLTAKDGSVLALDLSNDPSGVSTPNDKITVAGNLALSGTVSIDTTARTVALEGKVDVFPSFEAVLTRADGTQVFLYKSDPANGAVPGDLVTSTGGGSRPVSSGVVNY